MKTTHLAARLGLMAVALLFAITTAHAKQAARAHEQHQWPPNEDDYEIIWADTYYDALIGLDMAVDEDNDCAIVGIDDALEGAIIKYDGMTGEVIWDQHLRESFVFSLGGRPYPPYDNMSEFYSLRDFLGEICQQRFDFVLEPTQPYSILISGVDTDSEGNVVIVATAQDNRDPDLPAVAYVAMYRESDGDLLWERLLDSYFWNHGSSVVVTSDDAVIVVGVGGGIELVNEEPWPILDGWVYELDGTTGRISDQSHAFGILQPLPYHFDVARDANDNIFTTGPLLDIDWSEFPVITAEQSAFVNKHDGNTLRLTESYYDDHDEFTWLSTVSVDTNNDVYAGGYINDPLTRQHVVKLSNDLRTLVWEKQDTKGTIHSLAASKDPQIGEIAAQVRDSSGDAFATNRYALSGRLLPPRIVECLDEGYGFALAYDENSDIIVSGAIWGAYEQQYMYTMKYHIIR